MICFANCEILLWMLISKGKGPSSFFFFSWPISQSTTVSPPVWNLIQSLESPDTSVFTGHIHTHSLKELVITRSVWWNMQIKQPPYCLNSNPKIALRMWGLGNWGCHSPCDSGPCTHSFVFGLVLILLALENINSYECLSSCGSWTVH